MGALGAGRHRTVCARRRIRGAVTDGEDAVIARRLQRILHEQLIGAVRFETRNVLEEVRGFHAGRPDFQVSGEHLAVPGFDGLRCDARDLRAGDDFHAEGFEFAVGGFRQFFRKGRQDARACFEEADLETLLIEHFKAVIAQRRCRIVEFGGKLHTSCAAADDGDPHIFVRLRIEAEPARAAQALVQEALAERIGIAAAFKRQAVVLHPLDTEIVRYGAEGEDKIVIADAVLAHQLRAVHVQEGRDDHLAVGAVYALEGALEVAIAPAVGMGAVTDLIEVCIQRAGGDFVEQGLPDMRPVALKQDDVELLAAIACPQPGCELQPAGSASDDDNLDLQPAHSPSIWPEL